jgi:hypothetical protein
VPLSGPPDSGTVYSSVAEERTVNVEILAHYIADMLMDGEEQGESVEQPEHYADTSLIFFKDAGGQEYRISVSLHGN